MTKKLLVIIGLFISIGLSCSAMSLCDIDSGYDADDEYEPCGTSCNLPLLHSEIEDSDLTAVWDLCKMSEDVGVLNEHLDALNINGETPLEFALDKLECLKEDHPKFLVLKQIVEMLKWAHRKKRFLEERSKFDRWKYRYEYYGALFSCASMPRLHKAIINRDACWVLDLCDVREYPTELKGLLEARNGRKETPLDFAIFERRRLREGHPHVESLDRIIEVLEWAGRKQKLIEDRLEFERLMKEGVLHG